MGKRKIYGLWEFYISVANSLHWHYLEWALIGKLIFRIQMFYGNYRGYYHGGDGGFLNKIRLYNGDRITKVTGKAGIGPGADIDQLTFHTRR